MEVQSRGADERLPRRLLQQLFLTRVSVPAWWLGDGAASGPVVPRVFGCRVLPLFDPADTGLGIYYDDDLGPIKDRL